MYSAVAQDKDSNLRNTVSHDHIHGQADKVAYAPSASQKQIQLRSFVNSSPVALQARKLQTLANNYSAQIKERQCQLTTKSQVAQAKFYLKKEDKAAMTKAAVMKEVKKVYGNKTTPALEAIIDQRHRSAERFYITAFVRDLIKLKQKRDLRLLKARQISSFLRRQAVYGRGNVLKDIQKSKGRSVDKAGRVIRRIDHQGAQFPSKEYSMGATAGIIQEGAGVCDLFASSFHFLAAQKGLPGVKIEQETQDVHHTFNMIKDDARPYIPTIFADPWLAQVGEAHEMKGGLTPKFYKDAENHKVGYKEHDYTYSRNDLTFNPNNERESAKYLAPWSRVKAVKKKSLSEVVKKRTEAAEKDEQADGVYDQRELEWGNMVQDAPATLDEISDFESDGEELFDEEKLMEF